MYPRTLPGRILVFFLCIWGVFMLSLMVVALTNKVSLSNSETKALNLYMRLESKRKLEVAAAKIIVNLFKYHISNKNGSSYGSKSQATRAMHKIAHWVEIFKKMKRIVKRYTESNFSQDDLMNILDYLHKDLKDLKNTQTKIIEKNHSLSKALNSYAKKTHGINLKKKKKKNKDKKKASKDKEGAGPVAVAAAAGNESSEKK